MIQKRQTEAQKLSPFWNPVTGLILIIVVGLIFYGLWLAYNGHFFIGPLLTLVGSLMIKFGLKTHSPDNPREAGLLTWWDTPINIFGKTFVVGGTTILMDYFPFFVGSIVLDITNVDKDFEMKVMSQDNVQMKGHISVTLVANIKDLEDYIQAGKMENIILQLDDIVFREAQKHCALMPWRKITTDGEIIERAIFARLEEGSFGILALKIQCKLLPPDSVVGDAQQEARELLQRKGEKAEYTTTLEAAQERLAAYKASAKETNVPTTTTLEECMAEIRHEREIRLGQSFRIHGTGRAFVGPINIGERRYREKEKDRAKD